MSPDPTFLDFVNASPIAMIVEDAAGVCLFANPALEILLGQEPGTLNDRMCWELTTADAILVEREHERLLKNRFWYGEYSMRTAGRQALPVCSVAFTRETKDLLLCIHLTYPMPEVRRAQSPPLSFTAKDRCLLQLMTEGFSDEELTFLLGVDGERLQCLIDETVQAMKARSRTEACIKALKARLVS